MDGHGLQSASVDGVPVAALERSTSTPLRFEDALERWREAIARAGSRTGTRELGVTGYSLLADPRERSGEQHLPLVVERADTDPVQLRLANRIIAHATRVDPEHSYHSPEELLRDVDQLRTLGRVPPSRKAAFDQLARAVEASRSGQGQAVALLGDSGMGKTFLWHRVADSRRAEGDLFVYAKSPQAGTQPYGVYATLLRSVLDQAAAARGISAGALLQEIMAETGDHEGARTILSSILPDLPLTAGDSGSQPGATDQLIDYPPVLASLLVRAASVADGCVIALDDLQWADPQSVAIIRRLAAAPGRMSVVLMGRPEARERISPEIRAVETVDGLTAEESRDLLRALLIPGSDREQESALLPWIATRAHGNPLAIVETVSNSRQMAALAGEFPPADVVAQAVEERLSSLSRPARVLLEYLSLLLPPVPARLVDRIPDFRPDEIDDLLAEANAAGLLARSAAETGIQFYHDAIESTVRMLARASGERVLATAGLLRAEAQAGDQRAAYVLARMLTEASGRDPRVDSRAQARALGPILPAGDAAAVLRDAARGALALAVPGDTLEFARQAIQIGAGLLDVQEQIGLHLLAHEAAFLLDDPYAMSRHFRFIHAHGDALEVNRARTLWISRAYAKLWIRGATQIGWNILAELGAVKRASLGHRDSRHEQIQAAERFLRSHRPRRTYARIMRTPADRDPRSELVVTTTAMLLIQLLTIDPERMGVAAWIILREAIVHGPSPHTGMAFLYWSIRASQQGAPWRHRYELAMLARATADASPGSAGRGAARHTVTAYAAILGQHWGTDHRTLAVELHRLYQEGIRLANHEWAAHAAYIHAQSLFFAGTPLPEVLARMQAYREQFERLGVKRVSLAFAKWQQALECLMGGTSDVRTLTGSYCVEEDLVNAMQTYEDRLGRAGYHVIKLMLAVYDGRLDLDMPEWRGFEADEAGVGSLYPSVVFWFLYGLTAWANGDRERGMRALQKTRALGTAASGPHRITALRAARSAQSGRRRRADRLYARARHEALEDGFLTEAALIAERHAACCRDHGDGAGALDALHAARSLYEAWGARPAAARVSAMIASHGGMAPVREAAEPAVEAAARQTRRASGADGSRPAASGSSGSGPTSERALEQTLEYTRLFVEAVRDGLLLADEHGRILFRSNAAAVYLEVHADERVELEPALHASLQPLIASAVADRAPVEAEVNWNGRVLGVTVSPSPQPAQAGIVAIVLHDVSRLRERERALIVADRMSSLGMLASTVAHEVGNPNHVIQLNAQGLALMLRQFSQADSGSSPDPSRWEAALRSVESISEGTSRIEQVIRQVTEYAREGHEEHRDRVSPNDIAQRVIRFTRLLVREYTSEVIYEPQPDLPLVNVVRGRIEQALINLIKNACEALPGPDAKVALRVRRVDGPDLDAGHRVPGGDHETGGDRVAAHAGPGPGAGAGHAAGVSSRSYVCFSVCDQGPGIQATGIVSPDGSVGSPFRTTRGGEGGTGLGLSIVKAIVEDHGGTFRFTRDEEYASIAQVFVPVEGPRGERAVT